MLADQLKQSEASKIAAVAAAEQKASTQIIATKMMAEKTVAAARHGAEAAARAAQSGAAAARSAAAEREQATADVRHVAGEMERFVDMRQAAAKREEEWELERLGLISQLERLEARAAQAEARAAQAETRAVQAEAAEAQFQLDLQETEKEKNTARRSVATEKARADKAQAEAAAAVSKLEAAELQLALANSKARSHTTLTKADLAEAQAAAADSVERAKVQVAEAEAATATAVARAATAEAQLRATETKFTAERVPKREGQAEDVTQLDVIHHQQVWLSQQLRNTDLAEGDHSSRSSPRGSGGIAEEGEGTRWSGSRDAVPVVCHSPSSSSLTGERKARRSVGGQISRMARSVGLAS